MRQATLRPVQRRCEHEPEEADVSRCPNRRAFRAQSSARSLLRQRQIPRSSRRRSPEAPAATAKTATDLGQNRKGCTPSVTTPPQATCDIAVAFPEIGLNGTVTIIGSNRSSSNETLTFLLEN